MDRSPETLLGINKLLVKPLLGIIFDNHLDIDTHSDIITSRHREQLARQLLEVEMQPMWNIFLVLFENDDISGADFKRRDVHALSIDLKHLVTDELLGLGARDCESEAVDNVVETTFQTREQLIAGNTLDFASFIEVVTELTLHHSVKTLDLLLHRELTTEFASTTGWIMTVDAWRIRATHHRTFRRQTTISLEKEFFTGAATEFAFGIDIIWHSWRN